MSELTLFQPELDYTILHKLIHSELKRNPDSDGYICSVRGLAKLLGINHSSLVATSKQQNGLPKGLLPKLTYWCPDEVPESLKPVLGFDYSLQPYNDTGTTSPKYLPELVIQCVIEYYAKDARKPLARAQQLLTLFGTMGVRTLFAKILGDNNVYEDLEAQEESSNPITDQQDFDTTPVSEALALFNKLESYRFRRDEVVAFMANLGMCELKGKRNTFYRGVVPHKKSWRAQITVNGTPTIIGTYPTPEEAARAFDAFAKVIHGKKAKLNF